MKNIFIIFNREIKAFFNSAIAYIFIIVFLLLSVGLMMSQFFIVSRADMRWFFRLMPLILSVFIPAITMRLWAEDRKGNTLELLLTFPVKTYELVLGKFLAGLVFYITALASTLTVPIMISFLGNPDLGAIFCQYLGTLLLGGFFIALGVFVSGFCKDQIVSFIISMMASYSLFLAGLDFTVSSIDGWIPGLGSFLKSALGMAQHFIAFQKGVIDNRDLLYFGIGSAVFLVLNAFWLDSRLKPKSKSIFTTACLVSVGIFSLINLIFADMPIGRFDLTEGNVYTISTAAKEILRGLDAPVTVKLFISPSNKLPSGMKTMERDIRDKLDEFKIASKGNLGYKVFHLEAANITGGEEETLEKSIQRKGVRPFQVRSIEADEVGVKLIYSSISIAYKEKAEEVIPRITPDTIADLEYTVVSKIYKMTLKRRPSVALVAPYTEKVLDPSIRRMLEALGQEQADKLREDNYKLLPQLLEYEGYNINRIRLTEEEPIPEGINTLIIVEPSKLNERQRFEINRFLVNGGSVFIAAQRYGYKYSTSGQGGLIVYSDDKNPGINPLLKEWGLGISKKFLMDTQLDIVSLTGRKALGLFEMSSPVKLPLQIKVIPQQMNKEVSISSRLSSIFYLWGSALEINYDKLKELGLRARVLFTSSPESWQVESHSGALTKKDFRVPFNARAKGFPLAALIEGQFPSAFKGKPVPDWPKEEGKEEDESYEKKRTDTSLVPAEGKLILIGCSEMFTNQLFKEKGHFNFFLNAIDAITLGEKLIKIRNKQQIDRSLKKISTAAKAGWRIFTTFFIPVLLCIAGCMRLIVRRRSKYAYLKNI